ncbi:MAG: radical SAM protein [Candidatus Hydrogenedentes bacterium]|nr:radical SAM protein [Candidatus Hydrogenedentota bacterium]
MAYIRNTKSVCPVCCKPVDAEIRVKDGKAYIGRTCSEHGDYEFLLSVHGDAYADLDHFFNNVLDSTQPRGRMTNYWIISTLKCQMQCSYCSVETGGGRCREMTWEEIKEIIHTHKDTKLTLMGGEPTLYSHVLDFFREARSAGVLTQLATNGVKLADIEFCAALKEAGMTEVRLAVESTDASKAAKLGTDPFIPPKIKAFQNLEKLGITTIPSPTIFKGVNEDELINQIEYSKDKLFIHSISVNGFSWIGRGAELSRDMMIMPDEMMDTIFERYFTSDRESIFTFQKALYALLDVVKIRLCLYTQVMIFMRYPDKVIPITEYIGMSRLERGMKWWERFSSSNRLVKALALGTVFALSLKFKTLRLFPAIASLFSANILGIKVSKYPRRLLPVILNTNCSPLSYDEAVGRQCMSGLIFAEEKEIICDNSSNSIITKERRRYADTENHTK